MSDASSHECSIRHAERDRPDARCAQLAARQWSVLDVADLVACGLTRAEISRRVRAGRLFPYHCGVYAVVPNLSLEGCFLAAVKACGPDAVLSHYSAAALHGLLRWDFRAPEVTAPTVKCHPAIKTHRSRDIERCFVKGIPVTLVGRTLRDISATAPDERLRRAVNEALHQRAIQPGELVTARHRGARKLREILASGAPTENEFEDVVLAVLRRAGLPEPDVQRPYLGFRPDFRWPEQGVILEADGRKTHDQLLARADDARRQALFEAHGQTVIRISWHEAVLRPQAKLRKVRVALLPAPEGVWVPAPAVCG